MKSLKSEMKNLGRKTDKCLWMNNQRIANSSGPSLRAPPKSRYHPARKTSKFIIPSYSEMTAAVRLISPRSFLLWLIYSRVPAACASDPGGWGRSPVCLPYTPSSVHSWPRASSSQRDDRIAEEFLCSVSKPDRQDALLRPSTFSSCCVPAASPVLPLCWNMTCKYQTLALVTPPNTACRRASRKCLSSPQYVQCRLRAEGKTRLLLTSPTCTFGLCSWRPNERWQPALCLCKANKTPGCPDVGVKLNSWANNRCLLDGITCLKWHAGPKKGGDQLNPEERRETHTPHGVCQDVSLILDLTGPPKDWRCGQIRASFTKDYWSKYSSWMRYNYFTAPCWVRV